MATRNPYPSDVSDDKWGFVAEAGIYPETAKEVGMETEAVIQRHANRRTRRRPSEFYESVFVWRKP